MSEPHDLTAPNELPKAGIKTHEEEEKQDTAGSGGLESGNNEAHGSGKADAGLNQESQNSIGNPGTAQQAEKDESADQISGKASASAEQIVSEGPSKEFEPPSHSEENPSEQSEIQRSKLESQEEPETKGENVEGAAAQVGGAEAATFQPEQSDEVTAQSGEAKEVTSQLEKPEKVIAQPEKAKEITSQLEKTDESETQPGEANNNEPQPDQAKEAQVNSEPVETNVQQATEAGSQSELRSEIVTESEQADHTTVQSQPSEAKNEGPTPPEESPFDVGSLRSGLETSVAQEVPQSAAESESLVDPKPDSKDDGADSEIQSIMEQFEQSPEDESESQDEHGFNNSKQPRIDTSVGHPPRSSSLASPASAHLPEVAPQSFQDQRFSSQGQNDGQRGSTSEASSSSPSASHTTRFAIGEAQTPLSPIPASSLNKSLPPAPDPEPDLPFDFYRFLEQLRHRTADPVARFLRSFLTEFGKKQWMVHEQVKIISDFLTFITGKMAQCDVWRGVSDAEFDNAKEGMEKLVMNRLYSQTFSPAIPPPAPLPVPRGKKKVERQPGPGRRGQHQEDIERDEILAQKIRIYSWVREPHLDIAPLGSKGRHFLSLAQQELLKIKSYRAPRDKMICVLNCCKVIFGFLRNSKSADMSADSFVPLLIYVVLQSNPAHLVSNVQYILRFRNQDKLGGEGGYYLSSLMGAIHFIENLDRTALTISDEEFEKNVEAAVSAIAEKKPEEQPGPSEKSSHLQPGGGQAGGQSTPRTPRSPARSQNATPRPGQTGPEDEKDAVGTLLRSFQKPINSIGKIFAEDGAEGAAQPGSSNGERSDGSREGPPIVSPQPQHPNKALNQVERSSPAPPPIADVAAAKQASAEAAEAHRIQRAEHQHLVETLANMFPNLDRDVIEDVVRMKEGRVGSAVDACLALNN